MLFYLLVTLGIQFDCIADPLLPIRRIGSLPGGDICLFCTSVMESQCLTPGCANNGSIVTSEEFDCSRCLRPMAPVSPDMLSSGMITEDLEEFLASYDFGMRDEELWSFFNENQSHLLSMDGASPSAIAELQDQCEASSFDGELQSATTVSLTLYTAIIINHQRHFSSSILLCKIAHCRLANQLSLWNPRNEFATSGSGLRCLPDCVTQACTRHHGEKSLQWVQ